VEEIVNIAAFAVVDAQESLPVAERSEVPEPVTV